MADTLIGGTSATVEFVVNSASDAIQLQSSSGSDTVSSSVTYTLPSNVNTLLLTGTASLTGTANTGNDTLISNTGVDTLVAGSSSSSNDLLVINNASDAITVGSTHGSDTVQSAFTYTLPTNVNNLVLTGTAAIKGTANSGTDTLTSSTSGADTLVGGSGNDTFVLNNASDVVQDTSTTASNTIEAAFSYSLPTDINTLVLTGTAAVTGTGNSGTDTLTSNTGLDTLIGGTGNDTFVVNNGSDVVQDTSTTANNTIDAAFSYSLPTDINTLVLTGTAALVGAANSGTDTLTSNAGADTLVGGSGNDTFVVNNAADVIEDNSSSSSNIVESAVSYSLPTDVNTLILTGSGNISGTANSATDSITGNAGSDTLTGGAGSDTLVAGTGVATLIGGSGNGIFVVNSASDVVQNTYTTTNDTLESSVTYTLPTNVNDLVLTGTASLKGTANSGTDTLTSNTGVDTLVGGTGNDTFIVSNASDVVTDTSSTANNTVDSSVTYTLPTDVNSLVLTGTASLTGTANSGDDTLTSNTGKDTLVGGTLSGSNDLFVVNNASDVVTVGSTHGTDTIESSVSYTASSNVADLVLIGTGSISGTGNSLANVLTANSGADTLTAGSGVATMNGGSGNDIFVVNSASDVVQNTYTTTNDTLESSVTYTLPTNVNDLVLTGTASLKGTANNGTDTLTSNTGVDTLVGGTGNDTFIVSNASDVVTDTSSTANNTVDSSVTYTLPTDVNSLVLTGTASLTGTANSGDDTLTSNTGKDTLVGGTLSGSNDLFVVNNASDVVTVGSTHGTDTIESSVSYTASSNVADLVLIGTGSISGTGNSLANVLTANSGADTLTAGSGVATMNGGSGNDIFVVNSASDVVQNTYTTTNDTLESSVTYTLPTNVNDLILTGTASLKGTANNGTDTLTSNTGVDTLVGGTGNDTFVVSNASDVVTDTSSTASNTIDSSVTYTLPTDVNSLVLTGTASLKGTANNGTDTLTSNTGVDTLVGGTGNDAFVVSNASDVVTDTSSTANNTIDSSVTYTLPTDINSLVLTGTASLKGTANSGDDTLTSNTGVDTLVGGTVSGSNDLFVVNNASDVVTVGSTHGTDTIESSVSYTASSNVADLELIGTGNIAGTGNSLANVLTASSGSDTLTAGTGAATMNGGGGNDIFVVNSASDVVQNTYTTTNDTLESSVTYTLPTNVNDLILTGTASLKGTANSGTDTLTSNTGVDTLVGGTGNDTFVVSNASDVVTDTSSTANNTIDSSVTYTLPTDINSLVLTGTASLKGTANAGNDVLIANSGADTLVAGSGSDTLVSGAGVDSLVGGSGTDVFVVSNASDVVNVASSGNDTIQSSVSYVLPTNVQYLALTGSGALTGTGNNQTDLIVGNTGNDTLVGSSGISVLEGGRTAGQDVLEASSNQAALLGGAGSSTLTGGAYKDFIAAGAVSDSITTGATSNVVSINMGDSADTLQATSGATNVLSLGGGIDTESLTFTKSGNNLILNDGMSGDSITLANWYAGSSDQDYTTLQVVEIASADYNSDGDDPLRNEALEEFNFSSLVTQFNNGGSPNNWALSNGMPSAQLSSSATADYGGDLAYYFGLNGNLTGMNLSAAQATLTNSAYATGTQTIDSWSSISGGGGIELLARQPASETADSTSPSTTLSAPASGTVEPSPRLGARPEGEIRPAAQPVQPTQTAPNPPSAAAVLAQVRQVKASDLDVLWQPLGDVRPVAQPERPTPTAPKVPSAAAVLAQVTQAQASTRDLLVKPGIQIRPVANPVRPGLAPPALAIADQWRQLHRTLDTPLAPTAGGEDEQIDVGGVRLWSLLGTAFGKPVNARVGGSLRTLEGVERIDGHS